MSSTWHTVQLYMLFCNLLSVSYSIICLIYLLTWRLLFPKKWIVLSSAKLAANKRRWILQVLCKPPAALFRGFLPTEKSDSVFRGSVRLVRY